MTTRHKKLILKSGWFGGVFSSAFNAITSSLQQKPNYIKRCTISYRTFRFKMLNSIFSSPKEIIYKSISLLCDRKIQYQLKYINEKNQTSKKLLNLALCTCCIHQVLKYEYQRESMKLKDKWKIFIKNFILFKSWFRGYSAGHYSKVHCGIVEVSKIYVKTVNFSVS